MDWHAAIDLGHLSLRVSRPYFWLVTLWIYLLPTGGRYDIFTSTSFWLGAAYCTLPLNLLCYLMNDIADVEVDKYSLRKSNGSMLGTKEGVSRLRMLVPLGVPDAGKSTLFKKVLGIDVASGYGKDGRTGQLLFNPWPAPVFDASLRPAFVVDAPGFGDAEVKQRNDVMRLVASFAEDDAFCSTLRIVRVLVSGRKDERLDEMLARLDKASVRVLTVVTKVDENFKKRCEELPRMGKSAKEAARKKIADDILSEDKEVSGEDNLLYACMKGWGSPDAEDDDEQEGEEEEDEGDKDRGPPTNLVEDFKKYFRVLSRAELRQRLEVFMGLSVAVAPAAAPAVVDVA